VKGKRRCLKEHKGGDRKSRGRGKYRKGLKSKKSRRAEERDETWGIATGVFEGKNTWGDLRPARVVVQEGKS